LIFGPFDLFIITSFDRFPHIANRQVVSFFDRLELEYFFSGKPIDHQ